MNRDGYGGPATKEIAWRKVSSAANLQQHSCAFASLAN